MTAQPQAGLRVLEEDLAHEDEWVRLAAALVLDEMGDVARPSTLALQGVMQDPNKYVVRVANHALNQLLDMANVVP
jgi:HEAT repeat protein